MLTCFRLLAVVLSVSVAAASTRAELRFEPQEIEKELTVGYAVSIVDIDADGKLDIVVVDSDRVLWYQNPTWKRHTIIQGQTKRDNVCVAPYDINRDGKIDLALGADWRPSDTVDSGTIQWLEQPSSPEMPWKLHPIGTEPTTHRMRWADFDDNGRAELIVLPLFGRGTSGPNFQERPLRVLSFNIPEQPAMDDWKPEVINEELHVAHNLWPTDLDRDGQTDLLVVSFEGISLLKRGPSGKWSRKLIGQGNQETSPNRGASEIKHGRLAGEKDYLATIEPWHGFQTVVYSPPMAGKSSEDDQLWSRQVIDEKIAWGHAVWCANLDGDEDEELIIGGRDEKPGAERGVRIYDPQDSGNKWPLQLVDPGGVAVEDLAAADLDGDGKIDIVAAGRQTKNLRIYWNKN